MSELSSSNYMIWGVFPYLCLTLFFVIPFLRMIYRPFGLTTRASGMFVGRDVLGLASHLLHWGIFLTFLGHIAGLVGGVQGWGSWVGVFFGLATLGGLAAISGSVIALLRRLRVPEVRAMSQPDDYIVHLFLIAIMGVAIYQALVHKIWGASFTAGPWFASLWRFQPQPELMASAPLLTKVHIFLAFTFAAYFPFTKLIHAWTLPVNYFVRPYQVLRTTALKFRNRWEFGLVSDKSYMTYAAAGALALLLGLGFWLPGPAITGFATTAQVAASADDAADAETAPNSNGLHGYGLYVSQCARCHGLSGEGDGPGADSPTFSAAPRNLVSGHFRYVSTDNGVASDADLRRVMLNGLPGTGMPAFNYLSESQVQSLVEVTNHLWQNRPAPGDVIEVAERPPVTDSHIAKGEDLYGVHCASCHGPKGRGNGDAARDVLDSQGNPVTPRDLVGKELRLARNSSQLYTRVAAGMPDGPSNWLMPPFAVLEPEEIWAIVSYVEAGLMRKRLVLASDGK